MMHSEDRDQWREPSFASPRYRRLTARLVLLAFLTQTVVTPVHAQVVAYKAAPGNQQPTILNSANGIPLVNIQT
ncbi:MAG: hypothetical protein LBV49_03730, partial [Azonexus sp.]|nr:hypothetical protein [Azonexus sp.]